MLPIGRANPYTTDPGDPLVFSSSLSSSSFSSAIMTTTSTNQYTPNPSNNKTGVVNYCLLSVTNILHSFSPNWLRKPTSPKVHFDAVGGGGGLSGLHSLRTRAQASVFQFLKWGRIKLRMLSITCLRCLQTVNILGIAVCCLGNVEK